MKQPHLCRSQSPVNQESQYDHALPFIDAIPANLIICRKNGAIECVNANAARSLNLAVFHSAVYLWELFDAEASLAIKNAFSPNSTLFRQQHYQSQVTTHINGIKQEFTLHFQEFEHNMQSAYMVTMTDIKPHTQQVVNEALPHLEARYHRGIDRVSLLLNPMNSDMSTIDDDLIQTAKMAAVGQTMTSLAHELNQPLSAASTYLYSCRLALEASQLHLLTDMLTKVEKLHQRMAKIISATRNFARKSPDNAALTTVNMQQLIQNALILVETRIRHEKCQINNEITQAHFLLADSTQIEQVLTNILINALDAIAGQVDKIINLCTLAKSKTHFIIGIYDNGPGFEPQMLTHAFIPFNTTKEVGLGLGLSICQSILTRFNARIYLASHLKGGAMIVLEFTDAN